ncbi:hypothetical protein AC579_4149 [Pseudocercospora musae]|uniref:Uncharacterized protein n=1 Tax=Pseudocercospora musae TaxID=113226 RepID=A0A139IG44_9PEZI|nr:hypothetical protein AC579_4149 [Pseudocercospora musae]
MSFKFAQAAHMAEQSDSRERAVDNAAYGLWEVTRTLVQRDSSSSESSSSTCKPGNDSNKCVTPASVQNTQNLAIILGVVIPLSCAVAVLIFLHRRLRRKQKQEDIHDPHKSLDFGMEGIEPTISKNSKKSGKGPEMSVADLNGRPSRRGQGLSMDMGMEIGSPYMLPPGLNGSHESIHSMSRMRDEHDPYRPVTFMRPSTDGDSLHRFGRLNDDKGSIYSATTSHYSAMPDRDRAALLANARPISQSFGKRTDSFRTDATSPSDTTSSSEFPLRQLHSARQPNPPPPRKASLDKPLPEINEKDALPSPPLVMPATPEPAAKDPPSPPRTTSSTTNSTSLPPRGDSMLTTSATSMPSRPESSNYGDDEPGMPSHPTVTIHEPIDSQYDIDPAMIYTRYSDEVVAPSPEPDHVLAPKPVAAQRLSVMGMRPLPKELPDDTPEVRANRIRSFYKEYFDDSRPNAASMIAPQSGYYEDDYYGGVLDGVVYDPDHGGFFVPGAKPWAQGPARRAMTPPPRSRPRVSGNSTVNFHDRHASTMSAGRPRGRSVPRKNLPPPAALHSLPTPHKLKEEDLVYSPIDFAPPSSFREFQNGRRPDSPLGVSRPYSPSVRAFTPLASSFENLAVLPSPHDLRKSGTFTALDFAPPSKIRDPMLSPNDAGSIRSGRSARSGISAMQSHAVREGAYRVSRIPKEMVTTKDDLAAQLRPKMDMTTPA